MAGRRLTPEEKALQIVLGRNLKRARNRKKLKQREVAATIGTDNMQLSRWENGHASPRATTLLLLARIYELPIDVFFVVDHPLLVGYDDPPAASQDHRRRRLTPRP